MKFKNLFTDDDETISEIKTNVWVCVVGMLICGGWILKSYLDNASGLNYILPCFIGAYAAWRFIYWLTLVWELNEVRWKHETNLKEKKKVAKKHIILYFIGLSICIVWGINYYINKIYWLEYILPVFIGLYMFIRFCAWVDILADTD